jgi:hypothetical protein
MQHLPSSTVEDRVIALRDKQPVSMTDAFATLSESLTKAAGQMDDVSLEVDASPARLILKFRAYRHRERGT